MSESLKCMHVIIHVLLGISWFVCLSFQIFVVV